MKERKIKLFEYLKARAENYAMLSNMRSQARLEQIKDEIKKKKELDNG